MRAILMCVCVVTLAFAGCGDSDSGGSAGGGGSAGSGGTPGSGGTGNTSGDAACQAISESPCADEILDPGDLAECVEACEMNVGAIFGDCLDETAALLECLEQSDCQDVSGCNAEGLAFAMCFTPMF